MKDYDTQQFINKNLFYWNDPYEFFSTNYLKIMYDKYELMSSLTKKHQVSIVEKKIPEFNFVK